MSNINDAEHFEFPLGHSVVLINDFALRRNVLDALPFPLALKLNDEWVWMNQSARDWFALAASTTQSLMVAEPNACYGREISGSVSNMRTETVTNLEGQVVGQLAWGGHAVAAWALDQVGVAVWLARSGVILWANAACKTLFEVETGSPWSKLTGLPVWEEVNKQSDIRQIGEFQLRFQVFDDYVLAEYCRHDVEQHESTLSLEQVASMVHEIRNPLAALSGYVEMAQLEPGGKSVSYYDKMMREIDHLSRLTSDLMSVSRIPVIHPEWTILDVLVDDAWLVASRVRRKRGIKKAIILKKSYRTDQKVWADSGRLQQVLTNLIKNAVEAMIEIGHEVEVRCQESSNGVIIQVRDDGPGISTEELKKISVARMTTKQTGSGLGLMIVRKIVQAHLGDVHITSRDGTSVEFSLPFP